MCFPTIPAKSKVVLHVFIPPVSNVLLIKQVDHPFQSNQM
jgi:hypothetical protein